ncbi:MAG: flagellin [bacterium]
MYRGTPSESITSFDVVVPYQPGDQPWTGGGAPYGEIFAGSYYWEPLPGYTPVELQAGAFSDDVYRLNFDYPNSTVGSIKLKTAGLLNGDQARSAIDSLDTAIGLVGDMLSDVGIRERILHNAINDLMRGNIGVSEAKSRIEDANFAEEIVRFSRMRLLGDMAINAETLVAGALRQTALALIGVVESSERETP